MEYFYITCSLASLIAFSGYLIDRFFEHEKRGVTYGLIGGFVLLTVIFWLWFYLAPSNVIRNAIEDRTYAISVFSNPGVASDLAIVEGSFETRQWVGTIFLPPFAEPPNVILKRPEGYAGLYGGEAPEVVATKDSFSYKIDSSSQQGPWVYRARGMLLKAYSQ